MVDGLILDPCFRGLWPTVAGAGMAEPPCCWWLWHVTELSHVMEEKEAEKFESRGHSITLESLSPVTYFAASQNSATS